MLPEVLALDRRTVRQRFEQRLYSSGFDNTVLLHFYIERRSFFTYSPPLHRSKIVSRCCSKACKQVSKA